MNTQINLYRELLNDSRGLAIDFNWLRRLERAPIQQFAALDQEAAEKRRQAKLPKVKGAVAVIPVRGMITQKPEWWMDYIDGTSADLLAAQVEVYQSDPAIGAVLLDVHSPGGTTYGVFEATTKIAALSARNGGKPIIGIANSMACSAAFSFLGACDQRYVMPGGDVGSVGVYAVHVDWSKFNEQMGVKPTYLAVPPEKVDGNPDEPLSDEAKAELMEWVSETYETFVKTLAANYGISTKDVKANFGGGRVLSASKAKAAGMVDGIATMDDLLKQLATQQKPAKQGMSADVARRALNLKVKAG